MAKVSNQISAYVEQINVELSTFNCPKDWESPLYYQEKGQVLLHAYSVRWLQSTVTGEARLLLRTWNIPRRGEWDPLGIFHLDRLSITEKIYPLPAEEQAYLAAFRLDAMATQPSRYIVLDGLHCSLSIPALVRTLHWNLDDEMNDTLRDLIAFLRAKYHQASF